MACVLLAGKKKPGAGPVAASLGSALHPKTTSGKAQGAGLGHSKAKACNAE